MDYEDLIKRKAANDNKTPARIIVKRAILCIVMTISAIIYFS